MIEQTYPSGRVVKNVPDGDGDLEAVKSKKNAISRPYHKYTFNFVYNAAGPVTLMELVIFVTELTVFNSSLQPTQITLGTIPCGSNDSDGKTDIAV